MSYNFKKDASVYIVYAGKRYSMDVTDINFGQTYTIANKEEDTLQVRKYFSDKIVEKINPATWELTVPAIQEVDYKVLFNRALDVKPFDIYIETKADTFKIRNAVITNCIFITSKQNILSFSLQGQASQVSNEATLSGTEVTRSGSKTYTTATIKIANLSPIGDIDFITSVDTELQNNIEWVPYKDLNNICSAAIPLNYPEEFVIKERIFAGSIETYLPSQTRWGLNEGLNLRIGDTVGSTFYGFEFLASPVSYTTRYKPETIIGFGYDWRLIDTPEALSNIIKYHVSNPSQAGAILDSDNLPILDSDNLPILES